jgi:hypothetical protein
MRNGSSVPSTDPVFGWLRISSTWESAASGLSGSSATHARPACGSGAVWLWPIWRCMSRASWQAAAASGSSPSAARAWPSLLKRLRRFLDNPRVDVREWYEPGARQLLAVFRGQQLRLIIDCTKLGFNCQVVTVAIA